MKKILISIFLFTIIFSFTARADDITKDVLEKSFGKVIYNEDNQIVGVIAAGEYDMEKSGKVLVYFGEVSPEGYVILTTKGLFDLKDFDDFEIKDNKIFLKDK